MRDDYLSRDLKGDEILDAGVEGYYSLAAASKSSASVCRRYLHCAAHGSALRIPARPQGKRSK